MYLLDTNVISELRPGKRNQSPAVLAWAASMPLEMQFISSIAMLELRIGMGLKARQDPAQGTVLARWIEGLEDLFAGRILAVSAKVPSAPLSAPAAVPPPHSSPDLPAAPERPGKTCAHRPSAQPAR